MLQESAVSCSPESLVKALAGEPGVVLLRSGCMDETRGRFSFVTARPFLSFRAFGSRCETWTGESRTTQFGNPWRVLEQLLARYEILEETDLPLPLGGCFGFWGYDLKNPLESRGYQCACSDLTIPDCQLGFYGNLVAFDHFQDRSWVIATGLGADGIREGSRAEEQRRFWQERLKSASRLQDSDVAEAPLLKAISLSSSFTRAQFLAAVEKVQRYIRAGDIYQANLSQRLAVDQTLHGWDLYRRLSEVSPAPYAAYLDCGDFQLVSSSPELFLRLRQSRVETRPIKGTRPRADDSVSDSHLAEELQHSAKERAELIMITDLLRNDLGKICEYGSVHVPDLTRLEKFSHVQHLVSTVQGELRSNVSHLAALEGCFPGGSVTGAPKLRAVQIIDELEPVGRGPYTGALGYLGFNRESQLSIVIRTAICTPGAIYYHAGAGIVADSIPQAEYEETLIKARAFLEAVQVQPVTSPGRNATAHELIPEPVS